MTSGPPSEAPGQTARDAVRRVLIVEHDPAFRYHCVSALEEAPHSHYIAVEAASAMEAVAAIQARPVDCVLVADDLHDAAGVDLIGMLLAALPGWAEPVVVMTSPDCAQTADEMRDAGAADCISKQHVSVSSLRRALDNAIEKSRLRRVVAQSSAGGDARPTQDVKAPLTAIGMFLSMLADGQAGALTREQLELVSDAQASCDELARLLDQPPGASPERVERRSARPRHRSSVDSPR